MIEWLKRYFFKPKCWVDTGVTEWVTQQATDGYTLQVYMEEQIELHSGTRRWKPRSYHGKAAWRLLKDGVEQREWYQYWKRNG